MATVKSRIATRLLGFGAPADGIVVLDTADPVARMRYLDLLRPSSGGSGVRPDAVVEVQHRPVLFAIDGTRLADRPEYLPRLRRVLAFRGDATFMAVVEPGRLTIYDVALEREAALPAPRAVADTDDGARALIPELAFATALPQRKDQKAVHALLLELLDRTTDALARLGINPEDALSLTGRALFLRFLIDRHIITEADRRSVCPSAARLVDAFAKPNSAVEASRWLDATFNGDLLPLSAPDPKKWLAQLNGKVCAELSKVVHRTDPWGQLAFEWGDIDFGHVPVGLLSQVYERHSHRFHGDAARAESVHYTPRHIAEYVVDEAFFGLRGPDRARILDPACGAGVFLVAAFRRIVAAKWRREGRPPSTPEIRRILREQVAGFDVNEPALRLSALSLYLTALEVDPKPRPLSGLRFDNLRGSVLFDVRLPQERVRGALTRIAGALGPAVSAEHDDSYDVVLGNPPWTAWEGERRGGTDTRLFADCVERLRPIVAARLSPQEAQSFSIPDLTPDLPFVWLAMKWARRGGRIAMALHGRLLFRNSPAGRRAREQLFRAISVTGVLNGASLQQTKVWPEVVAPFCLLFAENRVPEADASFYYISPGVDPALNQRGQVRIDVAAAEPITMDTLVQQPAILKILFRGSALDVDVIQRIESDSNRQPLGDYWRRLGLSAGKGYQVGGTARRQQSASQLIGLPNLTKAAADGFLVDGAALPKFVRETLLCPRERDIYRAPLVLALESPGPDPLNRRARLALRDTAFTESFIGYSCKGHQDSERLARYLSLVLNSQLPLYYALMTSSKFGVERRAILKADYDEFPVVPFENLSRGQLREVDALSSRLMDEGAERLRDVDAWVEQLYGLRKWDHQVIADSLDVSLPFKKPQDRGLRPPSLSEQTDFANVVARELGSLLVPLGTSAQVTVLPHAPAEPWFFIEVRREDARGIEKAAAFNVGNFTRDADALGCSQMVVRPRGARSVLVGSLGQYRYWTKTRARLTALVVLREHQDVFFATDSRVSK